MLNALCFFPIVYSAQQEAERARFVVEKVSTCILSNGALVAVLNVYVCIFLHPG